MLVGVVGFLGSGKGTVADLLVENHGFVKDAFANPVKDATHAIFGWPRKLLEGDTDESREFRERVDEWWSAALGKERFTPRLALQLMGTEAGRDVFGENLWVSSFARRYDAASRDGKSVVVADVRFPNEMATIKSLGGTVVRVRRGEEPIWYRTAETTNRGDTPGLMGQIFPDVHFSEWAWIGFDQFIDERIENDGTLGDLEMKVRLLVEIAKGWPE